MRIDVRIAEASDLDTLIGLNRQVQGVHADLYPADVKATVNDGELRAFLSSLVARSDTRILLAEIDGASAGYAWIEIQDRPETPFTLAKNPTLSAPYLRQFRPSPRRDRLGADDPP